MAIRVGRWDCDTCGHIGIRGPETKCPNCGAPRGKDVKFYLTDDAETVEDENALRLAEAGADWICSYCGADNTALDKNCISCGNERTDAADKAREQKEYALGEEPSSGKRTPPKAAAVATAKQKPRRWPYFVAGAVALLVYLVWPRELQVTITGHTWQRTIEIENNREVAEEDWSVPSGGRTTSSVQAVHHYNKVFSHNETRSRTVRKKVGTERYKSGTRDLGNGNFKDVYSTRPVYENREENYTAPVYRDVPVYQTKYRYMIFRWVSDHPITANGTTKAAAWPSEVFSDATKWREGKRTEVYTIEYRDDKNEVHRETVGPKYWERTEAGATLKAQRNAMGIFLGLEDEDKDK
ncbi:MAG: hypothetical protein IAF08_07670 [Rhizobacter sp.]|nr:hypothetical protein [Chlorobiales bacterium]